MPIVYLAAIVLQGVFCETPTDSIASDARALQLTIIATTGMELFKQAELLHQICFMGQEVRCADVISKR
jgi:hypothetical protein